MASDTGGTAPPPGDLAARELPLRRLDAGGGWWRIHRRAQDPCFFSRNTANRFSSANLGVLYLADDAVTAFWEIYWDDLGTRAPAERRIARAKLDERALARVSLRRPVRVFDASDAHVLKAVSAPAATFSGDYGRCQAWALALASHPEAPDGILYPTARHRDGVCLALFEARVAADAFRFGASRPVSNDFQLVKEIERDGVKVLGDP